MVFCRFPHKHEGQLTTLRTSSISNKYLSGRGIENKLFEYVIGACGPAGKSWLPPVVTNSIYDSNGNILGSCEVQRKAMQDCTEATLGACWLTGGMDAVLQAGTSMKLCFGGTQTWTERYPPRTPAESPPAFKSLEEALGYTFNDSWLLVEALTHPSATAETSLTSSYNRLEFLGDGKLLSQSS